MKTYDENTYEKNTNNLIWLNLPLKKQMLLSKYYDSECNFFERVLVQRLLKNNAEANRFMAGLEVCSRKLKNSIIQEQNKQVQTEENFNNLWDHIEQRIVNEEHAAKFLGKRKIEPDESRNYFLDKLFTRASWGLGGAFASFFVFYVVFLNSPVKEDLRIDNNLPKVMSSGLQIAVPLGRDSDLTGTNSNNLNVGNFVSNHQSSSLRSVVNSSHLQNITNVANTAPVNRTMPKNVAEQEEIFDATPYLARRVLNNQSVYKVDWIRSTGSVSLIQQERAGAPIIWVSKRRTQVTQQNSVSTGREYFINPK